MAKEQFFTDANNNHFYLTTDFYGHESYLKIESEADADCLNDSYRKERNNDIRNAHLKDYRFEKLKKKYEDSSDEFDMSPFDTLASTKTVEDLVFGEEEESPVIEVIEQVKSALTNKQRIAIELRFYHNFTYVEIGAFMGISKQGAEKHVIAGLKKLRKVFLKKGITCSRDILHLHNKRTG